MCGIVGIHGTQQDAWVEDMNARIVHRGPDDFGVYRDRQASLALAMRRLSIIDLAGGAQPMQSADGRYVIVYNGEIYNSVDLRRDLQARGECFSTDHSDTEVLLRFLIRDGENCLSRLNGMFAFAFYDKSSRTILCARDGFGIKPFYYTQQGGFFAFSSELKALLALPFVSREIDRQALFDYLSLHYIPGEQSILQSVRRLPAGHWLKYKLDDKSIEIRRWWRMDYAPDRSIAAAEWPRLIQDELRHAVLRWCQSDVPIAVSLSGGLDSSAIASIAAQSGHRITAYSLGFEGEGEEAWNELPLARELARAAGLEYREQVLRPEATLDALPDMVEALDEPYAGGLPSWFVFREIGRDAKVALSGTGGDEMFGNYGKWRPMEGPAPLRWLRGSAVDAGRFRRDYFERFYYFADGAKREILADGGAGCSDTAERMFERFGSAGSLRDRAARLDIETQLPEEFLLMTDRFSMAHSVEARTPFLDSGFTDLVRRIPADIRTDRNDLKYLLRRAVAPLLPETLLRAPKRGFVIPFGMWLRGALRPVVEQYLSPDRLGQQGILAPAFYERYVRPHLNGQADHTPRIWAAMMFQFWHQRFIEGVSVGTIASRSVESARA